MTPWNHNTHYHSVLLGALPPGARRVLDVGCGDGLLASDLVDRGIAEVVAIDVDAPVLGRAAERHPGKPIAWIEGDFMTASFEDGSFDAVLSVATLHHLEMESALRRCADLVRPGGVVGAVGLASFDWRDIPYDLAGVAAHSILSVTRGHWEHSAPTIWPPPLTYSQVRATASRVLPGVRYTRHVLWRYSLVWQKPHLQTGGREEKGVRERGQVWDSGVTCFSPAGWLMRHQADAGI
jgi:SAM-dependent methyltransferase